MSETDPVKMREVLYSMGMDEDAATDIIQRLRHRQQEGLFRVAPSPTIEYIVGVDINRDGEFHSALYKWSGGVMQSQPIAVMKPIDPKPLERTLRMRIATLWQRVKAWWRK